MPLQTYIIEIEVVEGLEAVAEQEIAEISAIPVRFLQASRTKGALRFQTDHPKQLKKLRLAESIFIVEHYNIPRPKALLGDAHFKRLLKQIEQVQQLSAEPMHSFYIAAAGSESSVMQRLKQEIAAKTQLEISEKGDIQLRILPSSSEPGWEVHCRMTPRPLSARAWRVCWFKGALNATVARAMVHLTQAEASDTIVNLCCGSGTLLIEMGLYRHFDHMIGIDIDSDHLNCATENAKASAIRMSPIFLHSDAQALPIPSASVHILLADLPFGQTAESHRDNMRLYPKIFAESARIARPNARFVVITHEINLMESLLKFSREWKITKTIHINLRGLHPRIYIMERL